MAVLENVDLTQLSPEEQIVRDKAIERGDFEAGTDADPAYVAPKEPPKKDGDDAAAVAAAEAAAAAGDAGKGAAATLGDGGEGDDPKKDAAMIPAWRAREIADKAVREEREGRIRAEGELAALKGNGAAPPPKKDEPPPVDLKELRLKKNKLLFNGEIEEATEVDEQISAEIERRHRVELEKTAAESREAARAEFSANQEKTTLEQAAAQVIKDYPFLDYDPKDPARTPNANVAAVEDVIALRDAKVKGGMSYAQALIYAANRIGAPIKAAAAPPAPANGGEDPAAKREREARERGAAASQHQPPPITGGKGTRTAQAEGPISEDKLRNMTDAEYAKLSKEEKARLRGDSVEA